MSDTLDHSGLPEDELLAAEFALGVLEGAERTTAEQRVMRDRGFARLVEEWEQRLAPWAAEVREVPPPPQVWDRITGALPAQTLAPGFGAASLSGGDEFCRGRARRGVSCGLSIWERSHPREALIATIEGSGNRHFVATVDPGAARWQLYQPPSARMQRAFPSCGLSRRTADPVPSACCGPIRRWCLPCPPNLQRWRKTTPCLRYRWSHRAVRPLACPLDP